MKFDHVVKYNGKYYRAGEEVPIEMEQTTSSAVEQAEVAEVQETVSAPRRRGRRPRGE